MGGRYAILLHNFLESFLQGNSLLLGPLGDPLRLARSVVFTFHFAPFIFRQIVFGADQQLTLFRKTNLGHLFQYRRVRQGNGRDRYALDFAGSFIYPLALQARGNVPIFAVVNHLAGQRRGLIVSPENFTACSL